MFNVAKLAQYSKCGGVSSVSQSMCCYLWLGGACDILSVQALFVSRNVSGNISVRSRMH